MKGIPWRCCVASREHWTSEWKYVLLPHDTVFSQHKETQEVAVRLQRGIGSDAKRCRLTQTQRDRSAKYIL
jgi:hypothetical protein